MDGVTVNDKVTSVGIQSNQNSGKYVEIPFEVKEGAVSNPATVTIPALANGTVTTDKDNYEVGDIVTLTVTPNAGYAQKLYINGQTLILDWGVNTYSFKATDKNYTISGSFEKRVNLIPSDAGRWNTANQAHGILTTNYISSHNNESWWMVINGEYSSVAVTAKNYLPVASSTSYEQILRFTLSNGKHYAFRVYNDKGTYAVSCTAVSSSVSGWGNWKQLSDSAAAAMNGNGVQFKIERTAADTITVSVNGETMFTYKMDGITDDVKVTSVGIQNNGNKGQYVAIPYVLG